MDMQTRAPDLWIILDNSSNPAEDWSVATDRPGVLYERVHEARPIGWMRNRCLELALEAGADYIVMWDDDDYYPPERIATGVDALKATPTAEIAASSRMFLLLTRENILMEVGPYGPSHGTAATYTIRRRYAETNRFPDRARGEELGFTREWSAPMVQLPPDKTILVMGHSRNTVNKTEIYKTPHIFQARVLNDSNGKMAVRTRWPLPWGLFRSTFVDGEYMRLRESTPEALFPMEEGPTPRTEETEASSAHRA
jgi:glycosyltransferase involved in cell wall biosynthesis